MGGGVQGPGTAVLLSKLCHRRLRRPCRTDDTGQHEDRERYVESHIYIFILYTLHLWRGNGWWECVCVARAAFPALLDWSVPVFLRAESGQGNYVTAGHPGHWLCELTKPDPGIWGRACTAHIFCSSLGCNHQCRLLSLLTCKILLLPNTVSFLSCSCFDRAAAKCSWHPPRCWNKAPAVCSATCLHVAVSAARGETGTEGTPLFVSTWLC